MSAIFARALTMIAVVLQSYFNWVPTDDNDVHSPSISRKSSGVAYHLAGLVLARGGSKGIPKKNLAEINGKPLIERALNAMIESGVFTSIWVSTDDTEISNWIRKHYTKEQVAIHNRAAYTATDSATSMTAVLEFMGLHPEIDAIGLVQATSPFIKPAYLKEASNVLLHSKEQNYDSIFSVTRSHQLRWSVIKPSKSGEFTQPLNFYPKSRPRRQDWDGEMVENGMFYFVRRDVVMNYQVFQTRKSGYVEIPKEYSMEVDTFQDLEIARYLALKFDEERISNNNNHNAKYSYQMKTSKINAKNVQTEL